VAPLRAFENVHLHQHFLSRSEVAQIHREHGVALFATRFDSQGVSMGEAAMSGLAVISSDIDAARCFLPTDQGLLCEVENPVAYADAIERLYCNPECFLLASRSCRDKMYRLCRREETVDREIELIQKVSHRSARDMVADAAVNLRGRVWRNFL
ncbi:MAG: glycosyltransferase, partial [Bacteroides sp.]